jgi:molybdopterin converting factor small subunit
VLKTIVLVSAGATLAILGGSEILANSSNVKLTPRGQNKGGTLHLIANITNSSTVSDSSLTVSNGAATAKDSTYIDAKAVYFGMSAQMTGTKQEYFRLQAPAHLQDLVSQIERKHVVFATMLPTMQIVINGEPTQDNSQLPDNAEVDFIPAYAGG